MNRNFTRFMLIVAGVFFAAVIIGMIVIRDKSINTDITAHTTKVGLVITGTKNDKNFCQTHYDALLRMKEELNLEIVCKEHIPEDDACSLAIEELVEAEGCKIIVAASYGYGKYVLEMAKRYPDIFFLHPFGTEKLSNLTSCMGRMYQARYLSGIVAGMRTETGKIGYVAAFPNSEVIRGINAFTLGVRSVSPDAGVYVKYCGSWVDDDAADTVSHELLGICPDIDVLAMHTNSLRPNYVADAGGIWSVGYNKDNSDLFPNSYLIACELDWYSYYREAILRALQGKFYGEIAWLGMDTGFVSVSEPTANVAPGTREAVDAARERFASRSFDVFYGPVVDNKGVLRVPEGESMSDDEMLNRFDWYVEGVEVYE